MIIAQTIIDYLIKSIETEMNAVTGANVTGKGIAIKDVLGQVVSLQTNGSGEREYLGLNDTLRTYFYIRLNGNYTETRKAANVKRGSCGLESEVRVPLKAVMQHPCADPLMLLDAFKYGLFNTNFKGVIWGYDIVNIRIFPLISSVVSWEIYNLETGKDAKTMNSLMQIVSHDFELRFDLTYSDKCKKFKIC
jgi:hypothetical protein